jgi:hypothetical protein
MWVDRFKGWFAEQLTGQPGIAAVGTYSVEGNEAPVTDLRIDGEDGVSLFLRVVRTSPGGENYAQSEVVTIKG